jgi:hemerythrin superfamily protein
MDAISLLKQDHQEVSALFEKYESAEDEKSEIAAEVCNLLTVHARIEEEIFYPAAREALESDQDGEDLLDEAEVEHATAKELIAQIEAANGADHLFDAKVKVLGEYVKHHVKEEESELFPKLKNAKLDLETLGKQLKARKTELLSALAEQEDDDAVTGSPPPKAKSRARPTAGKR